MKRYILFAGYSFYPEGGWCDFKGDFDCTDDAEAHLSNISDGESLIWHHVIDTETMSLMPGHADADLTKFRVEVDSL